MVLCALDSTYVFWTARMFLTARMEIVGPGRRSERTMQQIIESRAAGMENDTCGRQVFHTCARKLRLVDFRL